MQSIAQLSDDFSNIIGKKDAEASITVVNGDDKCCFFSTGNEIR